MMSDTPKIEPVAWRYRYGNTGAWKYVSEEAHCNSRKEYQREPLYSAAALKAARLSFDLLDYLNAAAISAADQPSTVVEKLQHAIAARAGRHA